MSVYTKTTHAIKVTVIPTYLDDESEPSDNHYVWAYTVQVENLSENSVQLVNRHWQIMDALGQVQEVRGPGVVGEQPMLKPGEGFRYTSGTALQTSSGIMSGQYEMRGVDNLLFPIDIPAFSLDSPQQRVRPN